jgi:predicted  nucleic acid-binding Zn-ribbon protein
MPIAISLMPSITLGTLNLPLMHALVSVLVPILILAAAAAFAMLNHQTGRQASEIVQRLSQQVEAIPAYGPDQFPVVATLFQNSGSKGLAQAFERLMRDKDVLYQERWLPDPARELTLNKLVSGTRLAALRLKPAVTLLSIGLTAAMIALLLLVQQPLSPVGLSSVLPWPPVLVGLISALLLTAQGRSISDRLNEDLAELANQVSQRVPVYGAQTGMAQLVNTFMKYDRQMVSALGEFNTTAQRLAESDMAEGVRRSVEQVLFESVAPPLREATALLSDLATGLTKRQEQGMAELAGQFAHALTVTINTHLTPVNRELTQLAGTMSDIKNYTDYAVRSLESLRQDNTAQREDIRKALSDLEQARSQFETDVGRLDQQLARFSEASTRLAATYTDHERTLAQSLQAASTQLATDQKVLSETLQRSSDVLAATQDITRNQQDMLSRLNAVEQALDQGLARFASESEQYVGKTLGQFDQSLAQIVERLAQATGEIRDAVEALPAALRQTTHFR